jgi:hypothetical protein
LRRSVAGSLVASHTAWAVSSSLKIASMKSVAGWSLPSREPASEHPSASFNRPDALRADRNRCVFTHS